MTTYPNRILIDSIALLKLKQHKRADLIELSRKTLEELIQIQNDEIVSYNKYKNSLNSEEEDYREDPLQ